DLETTLISFECFQVILHNFLHMIVFFLQCLVLFSSLLTPLHSTFKKIYPFKNFSSIKKIPHLIRLLTLIKYIIKQRIYSYSILYFLYTALNSNYLTYLLNSNHLLNIFILTLYGSSNFQLLLQQIP